MSEPAVDVSSRFSHVFFSTLDHFFSNCYKRFYRVGLPVYKVASARAVKSSIYCKDTLCVLIGSWATCVPRSAHRVIFNDLSSVVVQWHLYIHVL